MQVGRITFGPTISPEDRARYAETEKFYRSFVVKQNDLGPRARACNCIGPQAGETKCPCKLRGEAEQGRRMLNEGIVVNGVEYDLVPRKAKSSAA